MVDITSTKSLTANNLLELVDLFDTVPDPDLVLQKLGRTRADMRVLETDDEISHALETRVEAMLAVPWRLEPDNTPIAEWLQEQLKGQMHKVLRAAWQALPYGYSVFRAVYNEGDTANTISGLKRIEVLPFEWFEFDRKLGWKIIPEGGVERPLMDWEEQFMFFFTLNNESYRNPYGESLLTRLYWPFFFRHNTWKFWMQCLEKFGTPLLIGKGPDYVALAEALAQAVQDAVIAVGPSDTITAVSPGDVGDAFDQVENQLIRRIQKRILGQTLSSDVGSSGSRALGEVQERVRLEKRDADIRMVLPTVQRLLAALVVLRFGESAEVPTIELADQKGLELPRAERDEILVKNNIIKLSKEYILDNYDYREEDIEVPAMPVTSNTLSQPTRFATDSARVSPAQKAIDTSIESTLFDSPIPSTVILQAIRTSSSPEELLNKLSALVTDTNTKEFEELYSRAQYTASILGFVTEHG